MNDLMVERPLASLHCYGVDIWSNGNSPEAPAQEDRQITGHVMVNFNS